MRVNRWVLVPMLLAAAGAQAQQKAPPGQQLFERYCAECHAAGFGHPGTQRLGLSKGPDYAVLEQRTDLSADYVRAVVRGGLIEMPPFRPTEIADRELTQLASYLSKARAR
jgi:mono/diheme cytochrome c family protein